MSIIQTQTLKSIILTEWLTTCEYIANSHSQEFAGQEKETKVLHQLQQNIASKYSAIQFIGPYSQAKFGQWEIDLVCILGSERLAIEGKYKLTSDGAIPDNRKEAFYDLYKLENCVGSGIYSSGLFLWLTNVKAYLGKASGDSADFSTHHGRIYLPNTPLLAKRARRKMPLPLTLKGHYIFNWKEVLSNAHWHTLVLAV